MPPRRTDPERPRGKPRGIRRDRDCVTCKARGLKCDLNRPSCLPCVQAGVRCGGYPTRVVWLDDNKRPIKAKAGQVPVQTVQVPVQAVQVPVQTVQVPVQTVQMPVQMPVQQTLPPPHAVPVGSVSVVPERVSALVPAPRKVPPAAPAFYEAPHASTPISPPPAITSEEAWADTDQHSLIKRLAALCSHILSTEDTTPSQAATGNTGNARNTGNAGNTGNAYLSRPETTSLLSDLCVFIQARLEGRAGLPDMADAADAADATDESLDMVRHRLTALARVNRAIEAANPFAFLGIATFAVFEVCDDTFGEWQRHLHGARHLLEYHQCGSLADLQRLAALVPGLLDILARLVWFDLSGSVVRGSVAHGSSAAMLGTVGPSAGMSGQSPGTSAAPLIFEDWHRAVLLDANFFGTVGLTGDTCALYVDVAKGRLAQRPVQACLRAAEQVLRVAEPAHDTPEPEVQRNARLAANVHRCAAALAVLGQAQEAQEEEDSHVDDDDDDDTWETTTHAAVDRLCAALAATPPSSPFFIHMAVGAYMAGMRARTPAHCAVVRQYWTNCSIRGISRYPGGLSRCTEHWRRVGLVDAT